MSNYFQHEHLIVYQHSVSFVARADSLIRSATKRVAVLDQLHRASASIPINIAESNAKRSSKEQRRFIDISNGSAHESAACLDLFYAKGLIGDEALTEAKTELNGIVKMLMGLRRSKPTRSRKKRRATELRYSIMKNLMHIGSASSSSSGWIHFFKNTGRTV
jgi:four helix bundle protein